MTDRLRRPRALAASVSLAFALTGLAAAPTAWAGRPMATEDASVGDAGTCQLEAWTERSRADRSHWLKPSCVPFGSTEFALGAARVRDDAGERSSRLEWHVKHLLRETTGEQAGYGLFLGALRDRSAPGRSGERALKAMATLPLDGETLVMHLNAGLVRERNDGQRRTRALWSAALDRELWSETRGFVEAFATGSDRPAWQVGVQHQLLPGRLQVDAGIGSVAGRWRDTRQATVGLVFFTPALLR